MDIIPALQKTTLLAGGAQILPKFKWYLNVSDLIYFLLVKPKVTWIVGKSVVLESHSFNFRKFATTFHVKVVK